MITKQSVSNGLVKIFLPFILTNCIKHGVITIETEAFRRIMERLEEYIRQAKLGQKAVLADDDCVDSTAVCRYLRICDKTLQRLRLDGIRFRTAWSARKTTIRLLKSSVV